MRPAPALAVLLLAGSLAGCLSVLEEAPVRAQPGDFVVADLVRTVGNGTPKQRRGVHLFLGDALPSNLPVGWDANTTELAVPGLVRTVDGMAEGETRETGPLAPNEAYGVRRESWVDTFPRNATLPRAVDGAQAGETVTRFGRSWDVVARNGTTVLEVTDGDVGTRLEHPAFWDPAAGTRMWRSVLTGYNATTLFVRHAPEPGAKIVRNDVRGRVAKVNATHVAFDRNPPLAGETVAFEVTLREIVFTEPGKTRAPAFTIETVEGQTAAVPDPEGRPVLLYFFATWCTVCKRQTPEVLEAKEELGQEAAVLAVTIDPNERPDRVRGYRDEYEQKTGAGGVRFAIDVSESGVGTKGPVSASYGIVAIPRQFVIGPDGFYEWSGTGIVPTSDLVAAVQTAQEG